MTFKEIKPGMVIHCPKEEDARALLGHFYELGYTWYGGDEIWSKPTFVSAGYFHVYTNNRVTVDCCTYDKSSITEFSDLIEPDAPEMSAVEVLKWLADADKETLHIIFDYDDISELLADVNADQIVKSIIAYEAAKKNIKNIKTEWVTVYRIIKHTRQEYACVAERQTSFDDYTLTSDDVLKEWVVEHPDGEYFVVRTDRCQLKKEKL